MSIMLLLELTRSRKLTTKAFPLGASSFKIPLGVNVLETVVGRGGTGNPAVPGDRKVYARVVTKEYRNGALISSNTTYEYFQSSALPDDSCNYRQSSNGVTVETCLYWGYYNTGSPATTGASTTGFGQTFVGGTGGPAASRQVNKVPVNPGQTYPISVASGGALTITYLE